jgi:hypothetical protein
VKPADANASSAMAITISDDNQRVLYSNGAAQNGYLLESNLDRPFSNWTAEIGLKNTNLDDLARDSFCIAPGQVSWYWSSYSVVEP